MAPVGDELEGEDDLARLGGAGKGLVGLLIASIMGAAVFAFGRRRLV